MTSICSYKYIDDAGRAFIIRCADSLGEIGELTEWKNDGTGKISPIGRNHRPRYLQLVALVERPGMQKYRTKVITNQRDYTKFLGKLFIVHGIEMRCIKFVGEEIRG